MSEKSGGEPINLSCTFSLMLLMLCTAVSSEKLAAGETQISGIVSHVRDVDTVELGGIAVRLNGIDGPELSTQIGQEAKLFMAELVLNREVACKLTGESSHDRLIGVCYLNGDDIGAIAIRNGFALDCRRYSGGRYAVLETDAAIASIERASYC
ncbi:thermonuclease family protein [Paracoccaceae bacterium]|nr:thermonuclease family protein [Paracoccaceae bacterium]